METRRIISVVFVDVADSTAMAEDLDPEDVRFLMARYYEHAKNSVTAYGGVVEKFIGDAVVAVFGIRTAEPDDARRAVSSCFSLLESIEGDDLLRGRLSVRCGVNTGEVVAVAEDASQNFLASGDVMNTAARIQSVAMPGEVAVGDRTMTAVTGHYEAVAQARHQLKGKRGATTVHTLAPRTGVGAPTPAGFVGRASELEVLEALANRTLAVRRPHMVTLFGQSGSGRTRLAAEAARRVASRTAVVGFARAAHSSPHAWLPALRGQLLAPLPDTPASAAEVLGRAGLTEAESAAVACTLFEDGSHPAQERVLPVRESARGVASWRILIEAAAHDGLLTLVFDDVHGADPASLRLIGKLGSSRSRVPVLVVTTARTDVVDLSYAWMETHRHHLALELGPMGDAEIVDLARQVAPGMDEEALLERTRAAGGNPRFMLELVSACPDGSGSEGGLPANVHSAVQATLDRLSPTARECARAIAVSNGDVPPSLLWRLLPDHEPLDVRRGLDELLEREVVVVGAEKTYVFVQSPVRDVAYDSLTRQDLAARHVRVATVLSTRRGPSGVLRAASHFSSAVELLGRALVPDWSAVPTDLAVSCLRQSARLEVAAGYTGYEQRAAGFLESALRICAEDSRVEVHESLGDLAGWSEAALTSYLAAQMCAVRTPAQTRLRLLRKALAVAVRGGLARRGIVTVEQLRTWCDQVEDIRSGLPGDHGGPRSGSRAELRRLEALALFCEDDVRVRLLGSAATLDEHVARVAAYAASFAAEQDWEAASEALDACQGVAMGAGDYSAALAANHERLRLELPPAEMADAVVMAGECLWRLGRGVEAIALVESHLRDFPASWSQRPLASVIALCCNLSFEMALWDVLPDLLARAETILDDLRSDGVAATASATLGACLGVLFTSFRWAVAQGDRREADRILRRLRAGAPTPEVGDRMAFLAAVCDGSATREDPRWESALSASPSLVLRLAVDGDHGHLRSALAGALAHADAQNGPERALHAWALGDREDMARAAEELAATPFTHLRARLAAASTGAPRGL